jgi:hypothetical protein
LLPYCCLFSHFFSFMIVFTRAISRRP